MLKVATTLTLETSVVFIHGFTGHPERTWTHKKGDPSHKEQGNDADAVLEPPPKVRKINPFSSSQSRGGESHAPVYWPRHLLPQTIPYARALTYGYDTRLRHVLGAPPNKSTVYDMAWDFLVQLEAERRSEPTRPILFVAHSLGGIFVKEALRRAAGCQQHHEHLQHVFTSTAAIVFFGTPHGGADPRGFLQRVAQRVIQAAGVSVNENVVNTLLPTSERLKELRDEFNPVAQRQNWIIHSFQEDVGINFLNGEKVVEDTSSCLQLPGIETTQHISRNHMDMCRFTGANDLEYKKVAAALTRIAEAAVKRVVERKTPDLEEVERQQQSTSGDQRLSEERIEELVESLRFEQIDSRQLSIRSAHSKTCKWFLKKQEYLDWLNWDKSKAHLGFLWVRGKPGTGKSTLMKFTLGNFRRYKKGDFIIISFFFNARGADLEKSTIGMYRSLLLQLLEQIPRLRCVFESVGFASWNASSDREWDIEVLKDLFQEAIQSLGPSSVACFVDALDECNQQQVRDMVAFFQSIGKRAISNDIHFQVLFSSRHYPEIVITKGLGMILEGQEGHTQDIDQYIDSELRIGQGTLSTQLRETLREKSSGVFMWVVLVVDILNTEHAKGRPARRLMQKLTEIPGNLHQLFRSILMRDNEDQDELLSCIQWLLFSRQPLVPEQLYFAILSATDPDGLSIWDAEETPIDEMEKFIRNASKGLAEVAKTKIPRVQFIHESVRDFLLKEDGLQEIWANLGENFEGTSHDALKRSCVQYLNMSASCAIHVPILDLKAGSPEAWDSRRKLFKSLPFLEYAVRYTLWHAEKAQAAGFSQRDFLHEFPLQAWQSLYNAIQKYDTCRYKEKSAATLLYVLAENDLPALIKICPDNHLSFMAERQRYGPPFFAATASQTSKAIKAMIEALAGSENEAKGFFNEWYSCENRILNFPSSFNYSHQRNPLIYIAQAGDETLIRFLDRHPAYYRLMEDWGGDGMLVAAERGLKCTIQLLLERTVLSNALLYSAAQAAVINGHGDTAKLLLEHPVAISAPRSYYDDRLLIAAAAKGLTSIVKYFIEVGGYLNMRDKEGNSALTEAAMYGHKEVVELLLATGKVEALKDHSGRTALSYAAEHGHKEIVAILLERGNAMINSGCDYGRTALSYAAARGHSEVVRLLLAAPNIDVGLKDDFGRTALSYAAGGGYHETVKLLLAVPNINVGVGDSEGRTALSYAARLGHHETVKLLLATPNIDVGLQDKYGQTPLSSAAMSGDRETVELLLATGKARPNSRDNSNRPARSHASEHGHLEIAGLLIAAARAEADLKYI